MLFRNIKMKERSPIEFDNDVYLYALCYPLSKRAWKCLRDNCHFPTLCTWINHISWGG
jgi:hypothetical protein